jgi:glycogen operon protein
MSHSESPSSPDSPVAFRPTGAAEAASSASLTAPDRRGHGYRAYAEGLLETGSVRVGLPLPLGTEIRDGGVNFAVFSRHATQVWLEIYDKPTASEPAEVIGLDPSANRTGDIWHVWVEGLAPGTLYGYRADGPHDPGRGHRFNPHKLLIDPYARALARVDHWDPEAARGYQGLQPDEQRQMDTRDNAGKTPKCVVTVEHFDWQGDTLLRHPWSETIIYEIHVRGFTQHASSGVAHPGTYRGLIEKIPYLQSLGITAVELLPVQAFNEDELSRDNPLTGERLTNYWGYNPAAFMAPHAPYASAGSRGEQVLEFKQMVRALHAAGIEVILDVVFNHTGEGNHLGPTYSWRGFDNAIYYMLEEHDGGQYLDFSGTGNSVKADHPVVREQILDALRYWVMEMHVDGFRFDLASVLGRDQDGSLLADPPLIERIAEDPILRDVKIIAEAWDAAGAYQVGSFSRDRWAEWNGPYRDTVRRFWRGDPGLVDELASRVSGSADLYANSGRGPHSSLNYVTSHDGFTLNDLVSYNHKHNEANGENNRDGTDANYSNNYGVEGPSDDPLIERTRDRQIRNIFLTLMLSRGVPMILGGDEFRRTQQGNNNAYCQDNEVSWFDWDRREAHDGVVQFVRRAIRLRRQLPVLREGSFYSARDVEWFDARGRSINWNDPTARTLGMHIRAPDGDDLIAVFHAAPESANILLPPAPPARTWHRVADTSRPSPTDLLCLDDTVPLDGADRYALPGRSLLVLSACLR